MLSQTWGESIQVWMHPVFFWMGHCSFSDFFCSESHLGFLEFLVCNLQNLTWPFVSWSPATWPVFSSFENQRFRGTFCISLLSQRPCGWWHPDRTRSPCFFDLETGLRQNLRRWWNAYEIWKDPTLPETMFFSSNVIMQILCRVGQDEACLWWHQASK